MSIEAAIDRSVGERSTSGRPIYVLTAALCLAAAVVGFGPNSAGILSGAIPIPPVVVHVHAALMLAWIVLFIVQISLMATRRPQLHKALGVVSFVLAPAMALVMLTAAFAGYEALAGIVSPGFSANIQLVSIITVAQFVTFYLWAVRTRRSDPETHKRMMVMATAILLSAATGRMLFLPGTGSWGEAYNYVPILYAMGLLVPAVLYDLVQTGRIHRAYVRGVALMAAAIVVTALIWDWPWWQRITPTLLGAG